MKKLKINADVLKILALICMTLDHIGYMILDDFLPFRIAGRIAYPIFAYFIAEGCRYTKNKAKHFLLIFALGLGCQVVFYVAMQSLYMGILIVFSLSILIIYAIDWAKEQKSKWAYVVPAVATAIVGVAYYLLRLKLKHTDFDLDYGFVGVLAPVACYLMPKKWFKLLALGVCLVGIVLVDTAINNIQWYSLLALIPLAFYSGEKGKLKIKYLFYIYYPLHMIAIYVVQLILTQGWPTFG